MSTAWTETAPVADGRVEELLTRLSLEEKVAQLMHDAPAVPRLGLPAYNWWNECLHGVGFAGRATVFPQAIGLGATFDAALVHRVACAIADEARVKHADAAGRGHGGPFLGLTFWSPNINIFRDPRWGRGQETYGEDPYLTSRLGVAFVRGLQGDDPERPKVIATVKHFAVHSGPELERHRIDAVVSARDLRETYLPAFEACVREAGVRSVMAAYNRVNGEACCASPTLLGDILRGEWGFDGYVVSDCWGIKDLHEGHGVTDSPAASAALALRRGCDLNCGDQYGPLVDAVRDGTVTEAEIDAALRRLLDARRRLGLLDQDGSRRRARVRATMVGARRHRRLARRAARSSLVLLENDGVLPLSKDVRRLSVVGPCGLEARALLGNYHGLSPRLVTPLEGITAKLSPGTWIGYSRGCTLTGLEEIRHAEVRWVARSADIIVAVLGYTGEIEGEEGATDGNPDRTHYALPGRQQELLEHLVSYGKPVVLVVTAGSPVDLRWAADHVNAILYAWYPGEQGGRAIADVLFGDECPSGRLPITFPRSYDDLPPFESYATAGRTYRFATAEPRYRFGYGLSYTTFAYRDVQLEPPEIDPGRSCAASAVVENVGSVAGTEVVQLYVEPVSVAVPTPRWHLEGFARVRLVPGQRRRVRFALAPRSLASFDDEGRPFVAAGAYRIWIGGGQPDDPHGGARSAALQVSAP